MKNIILTSIAAFAIVGCASHPESVSVKSVSTDEYKEATCPVLISERARLQKREKELYTALEEKYKGDVLQTTIGIMALWPMLLFLEGGDGVEATEYSEVKGRIEAINTRMSETQCK